MELFHCDRLIEVAVYTTAGRSSNASPWSLSHFSHKSVKTIFNSAVKDKTTLGEKKFSFEICIASCSYWSHFKTVFGKPAPFVQTVILMLILNWFEASRWNETCLPVCVNCDSQFLWRIFPLYKFIVGGSVTYQYKLK